MGVGFYYMANALGRLTGTVLSGAVYQVWGLVGCLWFAVAFVLGAGLVSILLPRQSQHATIPVAFGDGGQ